MNIWTRAITRFRSARPVPVGNGDRYLYAIGAGGIQPIRLSTRSTGNPLLDAFHGLTTGEDGEFSNDGAGWAKAYKANVWAFRCIKMRAQALAAIPLRIRTLDDTDVPHHPLARMIGPANTRLMYITESDMGVFGRAYWSIGRTRIRRINPATVEVKADADGLTGFVQRLGGQVTATWAPDEMAYFHDYDPEDDFGSVSPLGRALRAVGVVENIGLFADYFFKNGAMPSGILVSEMPLSQSDFERVQAEWNAKYSGVDNAHRTALLEGGKITYQAITPPLKDLAMTELHEEHRREIAGALLVPPVIAGITDAANYATAQEQRKSFYTEVILPELDLLVDTINRVVLPFYGVADMKAVPAVDEVEVLQEDRTEITSRAAQAFPAGVMSLNDALELQGLAPITDPDTKKPRDYFYIGGKLVARDALEAGDLSALEPPPPASPFGFSFPPAQAQALPAPEPRLLPVGEGKSVQVIVYANGEGREADVIEGALAHGALADLGRWRRKVVKKGAAVPFESDYIPSAVADFLRTDLLAWDGEAPRAVWVKRAFDLAEAQVRADDPDLATPEEFEAYWQGIGDLFDAVAGAFEAAWADLPARMAGAIREAGASGAAFDLGRFLAGIEDEVVARLVGDDAAPGPLAAVFLAGAARGNDLLQSAKALDLTVSWDLINQMAITWAREYGYTLVRGINQTTVGVFADKIADWIERGGTLDDLAAYIEGGLSGLDVPEGWSPGKMAWATSPERARLIAQTETTRAYFEGAAARWEQVGVAQGRWRTNQDAAVCELCRPLNNVVAALKSGWPHPRDGQVYRPPAHAGCRCFAAPVVS